jgi:hypothetical protein
VGEGRGSDWAESGFGNGGGPPSFKLCSGFQLCATRGFSFMVVPQTVAGQIGVLTGICGVVALAVLPGVVPQLGGIGLLLTAVAAGCCLLPGCLLFVLQHFAGRGSLVVALLVGMGARVGCCLLGLGWLHGIWQLPLEPVVWVLMAFYLATLACETWILSCPEGRRGSVSPSSGRPSSANGEGDGS